MNATDRERVKDLLSRAARLDASERRAFIQRHAGGDAAIEAEALDLLSTLDDSAFMTAPTGAGFSASLGQAGALLEGPGAQIGRYKLLQLVGEGGFGSVFMAEQTEPVVRRVALKIIKAGMDTRQVIARFEAERQALALMDHPNIARVLDAGTTDSGRPFFVMELVRGEPITAWCDRNELSVRRRLDLFRQVCHAVQHAHQKGIIHRDLKPTNVLVTVADSEPLPKVIDFGIAKATSGRLTDKTLFTELHQLIGTPQYMSPEQAEDSGVDIDTRSDIYALGVLLYELLSGTTPLDTRRLRSAPVAEIQRIIREEEPPRPSLRLATLASSELSRPPTPAGARAGGSDSSVIELARRRGSEPVMLARALRGDLDWIVMKCLEKDRRRRYATASELAEDIGRYLGSQPVLATPPSTGYRVRKFVRRNRGPVFAGGLIAATLLIATAVSLTFAFSATRQRKAAEVALDRAERAEADAKARADELEQVAQFQQDQLSGIDAQSMGVRLRTDLMKKARAVAERAKLPPDQVQARMDELDRLIAGSDFTGMALDALEVNFFRPALEVIDRQFGAQPLVKARLLQTLASTLAKLGLLDAATAPQREALTIRRAALGDDDPVTLATINSLARLLQDQGKLDEAEPYAREALEKFRRVQGSESAGTIAAINNMGFMLDAQGKPAEAEPYYREALERSRRVNGEANHKTLTALSNMGFVMQALGRPEEAEKYYRDVLEKSRRVLGENSHDTIGSLNNLGVLLQSLGRLEEAEALGREALEKARRVKGDDHPDTLRFLSNLGVVYRLQGKLAEAEPVCREALQKSRRTLGDDHPDTLTLLNNLGVLMSLQGKLEEAETLCREGMDKRRRLRGDEDADTLISIGSTGAVLVARGKAAEAAALLTPVEPAARRIFVGGNAFRLGRILSTLGRARLAIGELALAEKPLLDSYAILKDAVGAIDANRLEVLTAIVRLYEQRHAAEPGNGWDAKAAEWGATLAACEAGMQPPATRPASSAPGDGTRPPSDGRGPG